MGSTSAQTPTASSYQATFSGEGFIGGATTVNLSFTAEANSLYFGPLAYNSVRSTAAIDNLIYYAAGIPPVDRVVIDVDPATTYLFTYNDAPTGVPVAGATPIRLSSHGLVPGNWVRLDSAGSYYYQLLSAGTFEESVNMIGVFSSTSALLPNDQLNRVSGAVDAGFNRTTGPTFFGGFSTDIREDFLITGGVTLQIPLGANYLFVSADDILFWDNAPGPAGFNLSIEKASPPSIEVEKPKIEIVLDPIPNNGVFIIDATPTMPTISARARVLNVDPDPTGTTLFTWIVGLSAFKNSDLTPCNQDVEVRFDDEIAQNLTTLGDLPFTVKFIDPTAFRGGQLKLTVTAIVNGQTLTASTPDSLQDSLKIRGTNPLQISVRDAIDQTVDFVNNFSGLALEDVKDALKRVACRESGWQQFNAPANGGIGPVLTSCDNGVGIFQITRTSTCDDPFSKDCRNVLFNWRDNVTAGVQAFQNKVVFAKAYPKVLAANPDYRSFIKNVINPRRVQAGLKPISGFPAPAFEKRGLIGSTPPNQLLEDAIRGYNGWAGQLRLPFPNGNIVTQADGSPFVLHEFVPDADYLAAVPNELLPKLQQDQRVWRRVRPEERSIPDQYYVDNVQGCAP